MGGITTYAKKGSTETKTKKKVSVYEQAISSFSEKNFLTEETKSWSD